MVLRETATNVSTNKLACRVTDAITATEMFLYPGAEQQPSPVVHRAKEHHEHELNDIIEAPYNHPSKHVARHYTHQVYIYYSMCGVYVFLQMLSGSQNGVKGHANTAWHNGMDDIQEFLQQDSGSKTAYELIIREEVIDDSLVMTEFKPAPYESDLQQGSWPLPASPSFLHTTCSWETRIKLT